MKTLQEITPDWDIPNHVYFVNDSKDKMFAYVKKSTGELQEFKKPLPFSSSRRKFKEINNIWGFFPREELVLIKGEYKVTGSQGNVYTVTEEPGAWSCTCPASKWQKGECKHIKQIKQDQLV